MHPWLFVIYNQAAKKSVFYLTAAQRPILTVMTPKQLETIGKHLFGNRWKSALGRELGLGYSQIRRYMTKDTPIPKAVALAVLYLNHTRR